MSHDHVVSANLMILGSRLLSAQCTRSNIKASHPNIPPPVTAVSDMLTQTAPICDPFHEDDLD